LLPDCGIFQRDVNQCQVKVIEPVVSGSGENFSLCPVSSRVSELHFNVGDNFGSSVEYGRAEKVFDESPLIQNVLLCPKSAKIPVTKYCESQSFYDITTQN
jgi:hypothetical protein